MERVSVDHLRSFSSGAQSAATNDNKGHGRTLENANGWEHQRVEHTPEYSRRLLRSEQSIREPNRSSYSWLSLHNQKHLGRVTVADPALNLVPSLVAMGALDHNCLGLSATSMKSPICLCANWTGRQDNSVYTLCVKARFAKANKHLHAPQSRQSGHLCQCLRQSGTLIIHDAYRCLSLSSCQPGKDA